MDFTHLKLNTPLQNYPETINNNFMLLGNTIDNFYISNDKIKEFKLNKNTDLKTLKNRKIDKGVLISPVYNTSVNSEIGTFNILQSNKLTVGTIITNNIPNFVKYSKLDVNYFYIDDDGVVSINRELFDKDFENINLIWHDSKNNNLLVGEIALDSQTIKISEDIRDTNIFGDESFKKLEEGNNNINIGNNNVVKSSSANNNVLICNNYNTDNINPHNYNI
ncbi:MAG: hypothetical protein RSC92_05310, partial [Clostridia bacterium]